MQEIGVGDVRDQRHASLDAGRFLVVGNKFARRTQRRKGQIVHGWEAQSSLHSRAASAVASRDYGAVTAKTDRTREDRLAPALRNQPAKRLANAERRPVPRRGAEQAHAENRAPMGVD